MKERRRFDRFQLCVPVRIELAVSDHKRVRHDSVTYDLSASGAYLKLRQPMPEGSRVDIEIFLDFDELKTPADPAGSLIIKASGQVVRTAAGGAAIHFNNDYEIKAREDSIRSIRQGKHDRKEAARRR